MSNIIDVYEMQDTKNEWLIVQVKMNDGIHGYSKLHTIVATTKDKGTAQMLVEALRGHFDLG